MLSVKQMRYFVAIAEEASFSRASARLGIVQSALTKSIHNLEDYLGVELLLRTPKGVELNAAGTAFLEQARRLIEQASLTEILTKQAAQSMQQGFKIGFVGLMAYKVMPRLLAELHACMPQLRVSMEEGLAEGLLGSLRRGEIDLALVNGLEGTLPTDGLHVAHLFSVPVCAVLPANSPLSTVQTFKLADLRAERLVMPTSTNASALHAVIMSTFTSVGIAPNVVIEVPRFHTVLELVAMDFCVSILPDYSRWFPQFNVCWRQPREWRHLATFETLAVWRDSANPILDKLSLNWERLVAPASDDRQPPA